MELLSQLTNKTIAIFKNKNNDRGQLLIEVLVVFAISGIIFPALFAGFITSSSGKAQQKQRIAAIALLKESEEAIKNIRERDWNLISTSGTYHPEVQTSEWILVNGSEPIDGFTRRTNIEDVYRDSSGTVVAIGGTLDPSTKRITSTVSWGTPIPTSVSSTIFLTRYLSNSFFVQTSETDFDLGAHDGTSVQNNDGGEVTLGAGGGGGNWCNPSLSITTVNLSRQGVPTAISAYAGNIVTGTGGNASGPTFVKIDVVGNNPPVATINGEFDNAKANGVFTESNYGYIATTSNSKEIQILNLSQYSNPPTNTKFVESGYFNAPGNGEGNSVFVANNVGYMTDGNKFYTFDLSSKSGARTHLNPSTSWSLAGTGNKVVVVGNYAYIAVNSTTTQLQIIDVSNPTNPSIVASANVGNGQNATDVSVNSTGTRAYLVTNNSAINPEFFIINTTTKSGPLSIAGSFNTGTMSPKGVSIATGNRAIIVGTGGTSQYQVLNINDEANLSLCASLPITNGAYAISSVIQDDGYAYSYVVTGDSNAELKMILGGAGGQYSTDGEFTSDAYDAGATAAFNRFVPNFTLPPETDLRLQVAVADAIAGACTGATYSFIGPDGTNSTYFTGDAQIPLINNGSGYVNPGQCFKYKAIFSTNDFTASPVFEDITVNYSP